MSESPEPKSNENVTEGQDRESSSTLRKALVLAQLFILLFVLLVIFMSIGVVDGRAFFSGITRFFLALAGIEPPPT